MIEKIEMFMATCDNCKSHWENHDGIMAYFDADEVETSIKDDEWITIEGRRDVSPDEKDKHYCPACYSYDEQDNLVIDKERFKTE